MTKQEAIDIINALDVYAQKVDQYEFGLPTMFNIDIMVSIILSIDKQYNTGNGTLDDFLNSKLTVDPTTKPTEKPQ